MNRCFQLLMFLFLIPIVGAGDLSAQSPGRDTEPAAKKPQANDEKIDFDRARELFRKKQNGGRLSADEEAYLTRALEARRKSQPGNAQGRDSRTLPPGERTGLKPVVYT